MASGDTGISGSSQNSTRSRPVICSGEYFLSRSFSTLARSTKFVAQLRRLEPARPLLGQRVRGRGPVALAPSTLRRNSRKIVEGERPRLQVSWRMPCPPAEARAISSRSAKIRQRPFRSRPRRGRTPPDSRSQPRPFARYVPASAAGDELTPSHRRPEPRKHVSNHAVIELHHQQLNTSHLIGVAITARTEGTMTGTI